MMRNIQFAALAALLLPGSAYAAPRQPINDRRYVTAAPARNGDECDTTTYTIITPKPGAKPTPVTNQFQPVYSCTPDYVVCDSKNKEKCETVYKTSSYRWLSTEIPCYNGMATITRVNQPITIAAYPTHKVETCRCEKAGTCYYGVTSTVVSQPTQFPYINTGWEYEVCNYNDYYKWYNGEYSPEFSGMKIHGGKGGYAPSPQKSGPQGPRPYMSGGKTEYTPIYTSQQNGNQGSGYKSGQSGYVHPETNGRPEYYGSKNPQKNDHNGNYNTNYGYISGHPTGNNKPEYHGANNPVYSGSGKLEYHGESKPAGYHTNYKPGYHGDNKPVYHSEKPGYYGEYKPGDNSENKPGYHGEYKPSYNGEYKPGYRGQYKPGYHGGNKPGYYGENKPAYHGEHKPTYHGEYKPGYHGDYKSRYQGNDGHKLGHYGGKGYEGSRGGSDYHGKTDNYKEYSYYTKDQGYKGHGHGKGKGSKGSYGYGGKDTPDGGVVGAGATTTCSVGGENTGNSAGTSSTGPSSTRDGSASVEPTITGTSSAETSTTGGGASTTESSNTGSSSSTGPDSTETSSSAGPDSTETSSTTGPGSTETSPTGPDSTETSSSTGPDSTETSSSIGPDSKETSSTTGPDSTETSSTTGPDSTETSSATGPDSTETSSSTGPDSTETSSYTGPDTTETSSTTGPDATETSSVNPSNEETSSSTGPDSWETSTTPFPTTVPSTAAPTTDEPSETTTDFPSNTQEAPQLYEIPEGLNSEGTFMNIGDFGPCAIKSLTTAEALQECKRSGGKIPTNLVGCITDTGIADLGCILECNKDLDTVLLAQRCLKKSGNVQDPAIRCARMGMSGGSQMLYKACVASQGGRPCSRQFLKNQAIEDATAYATECAAAGLLSGTVKRCVETARLGLDIGSGVRAIHGVKNVIGYSGTERHDSLEDVNGNIHRCFSDLLAGSF
ncbi:hypothetical protein TWF506_005911 [Arthrobotrys conoides]|uniref:Uncharacterized protein n=1 Tax=Arthrobotrys conoides TaxID=74498 RepID=A0AAN8NUZ2_9PEZI